MMTEKNIRISECTIQDRERSRAGAPYLAYIVIGFANALLEHTFGFLLDTLKAV